MRSLTQPEILGDRQSTILAIEDDEDNLIYLSCALALFKYHCITAQDAWTGLTLAQKYQPDLILLDIKMPKISGIELIRTLKLDWLTRNIPIVAVTALAREWEKKLILDAGFSDYLVKPYLLEDLERITSVHILKTSLF